MTDLFAACPKHFLSACKLLTTHVAMVSQHRSEEICFFCGLLFEPWVWILSNNSLVLRRYKRLEANLDKEHKCPRVIDFCIGIFCNFCKILTACVKNWNKLAEFLTSKRYKWWKFVWRAPALISDRGFVSNCSLLD